MKLAPSEFDWENSEYPTENGITPSRRLSGHDEHREREQARHGWKDNEAYGQYAECSCNCHFGSSSYYESDGSSKLDQGVYGIEWQKK